MRNSDDLDSLLARFRPVGPPPGLREGIIGARGGRRSLAEWLPAAAALLLVVLFHWLATAEGQLLESRLTPLPPIDQALIELMEPQG